MNKTIKDNLNIKDIYNELISKYSLSSELECNRIISKAISKSYNADSEICNFEDNSVVVYFKDKETGKLKGVTKNYSAKKIKIIKEQIYKFGQKEFLNKKREYVKLQIKTKKHYFYSIFSHSNGKFDYYDLYLDRKLTRQVKNILGECPISEKKRKRFYIDFRKFRYKNNNILYKESENIKVKSNFIQLIKELSREIFKKIEVKISIEYIFFQESTNTVYLYHIFKTRKEVLEYIQNKFYEVFEVNVIFLAKK